MGSLSRWAVFLFVFLSIYGSLHLYLLIKVKRAFYVAGWNHALLLVVLLFLLLAPIHGRILESQGYATFSIMILWIAYVWMGWLFLFVCLGIPLDAYHLLMGTLQQLFDTDLTDLMLSRRQSVLVMITVACGLFIYGAHAAYQVQSRHMIVHSAKIPESVGRIRIVQISDLHVGPMTYPGRLNSILAAISKAQPDILVSTGDLVDGIHLNSEKITGLLKAIPAPMGKFAVIGNHEFYMGIRDAVQFKEAAGFRVLRGTAEDVAEKIVIAGVDDPAGGPGADAAEAKILANVPEDRFSILLKHRPVIAPTDGRCFDLQLSGHTHAGQIFPLRLLIMLVYPKLAGWYQTAPESYLYVSRGTGTWGPPIRLLASPEITIFDLVPELKD